MRTSTTNGTLENAQAERNLYFYDACYLDPANAMWLSVDPLLEKYLEMTPYQYCAGNPVKFIDLDGMFAKSYSDEELESYGLTKEEVARFESIIKNIGNILTDEALSAISNTTGLSIEQIKEDMVFGNGPLINLTDNTSFCSGDEIFIGVESIKQLANASGSEQVRGKQYSKLSEKSFFLAMEILHEHAHYRDQKTNGTNTGQYLIINGVKKVALESGWNGVQGKATGKQNWHESKTGHRGDDVTFFGFGVCLIANSQKQLKIN